MKPIDSKKIEELLTRGVERVVDRDNLLARFKSGKVLRVKHGVDPTAPFLHLGNAIPIWKLRDFQELGHQVVMLIGDFTARIGDTSDKSVMRPSLSQEEIEKNMKTYKKQIGKILNLEKTEFVYNSKWLQRLNFAEILNMAGNFTVAQMIERENFFERYKAGKPIGLQEFFYPLMQGYDSVALKADIEIGGTDQTFNMMAGRVLQRAYGQEPQDVIMFQLIEGLDGRKMSKSFNNFIAITDEPKEMFGKVMSMKDELIIKYFILCTKVSMAEVLEIEKELKEGKINPRDAKAHLAKEIVVRYYNEKLASEAEKEFNRVFREKEKPSEMPEFEIKEKEISISDLLTKTKLAPSKSEARRLIEQGGIKINDKIIEDWKTIIKIKSGIIVQVGRRKFARVK